MASLISDHEWRLARRSFEEWRLIAKDRGVNKEAFYAAVARGKSPMEAAMPLHLNDKTIPDTVIERRLGLYVGAIGYWKRRHPSRYSRMYPMDFGQWVKENLSTRKKSRL